MLFVWATDALLTLSSTVAEGFAFLFPAVAAVFWFTIADDCFHSSSTVADGFGVCFLMFFPMCVLPRQSISFQSAALVFLLLAVAEKS